MSTPYPGDSNWPSDFQGSTLTGTYVTLDGAPVSGSITLSASPEAVISAAQKKVVVPRDLVITLDGTGSFSIVVPATDDPDINPQRWTYHVRENFTGGRAPYDIQAPAGATVDITVAAPVPSSTGNPITRGADGTDGLSVTAASVANTGTLTFTRSDGSSVVATGGVATAAEGPLTPLHYGAVGNGIADDTTAMQNWLTALATTKGDGYLPSGTYLTGALSFTGSYAEIRGSRAATVKLKNGANSVLLSTPNDGVQRNGLRLRGFTLDGNAANQTGTSPLIDIFGMNDFVADGLYIANPRGPAIRVGSAGTATCLNPYLANLIVRGDAVNSQSAGLELDSQSSDGHITNADIGGFSFDAGILLSGHFGAFVANCDAWQCKWGYHNFAAHRTRYQDCLADFSKSHGFFMQNSNDLQFATCQARESAQSGINTGDGFFFQGASTAAPATDIVLVGTRAMGSWQRYGINFAGNLARATTAGSTLKGNNTAASNNDASNVACFIDEPAVYVDRFGADPSGATFSDAAFAAAITAMGPTGRLVLGKGTYKLANAYTLARTQGLIGAGATLTSWQYTGTGTALSFFDATFSSSLSNAAPVGGFSLSGYSAGVGAIGMRWGNLNQARVHDVQISGFNTAGGIGLQLKNGAGAWSEQGVWTAIKLVDNTANVVFDSGSFDYSRYEFLIVANPGQDGVLLQNNAQIEGGRVSIAGNFNGGTANLACVLGIDKNGGGVGTSRLTNGRLDITVECDGTSGLGHTSLNIGSAAGGGIWSVTGTLTFTDLTIPFVGASINGSSQFGFSGAIVDNGLGKMTNSGGLGVYGGIYQRQTGGFSSGTSPSVASSGMTLFMQYSDVRFLQLINGAVTIASIAGTSTTGKFARRLLLMVKQPSSGAAGTITWPAGAIKWAGGVSTLSTANNAVDKIELLWSPTEGFYYGQVIQNFA